MDNKNTLTLGDTDRAGLGAKLRFNLNDQTWSTKVLNQTFEGKTIEDLHKQIETVRKQIEDAARDVAEKSPSDEKAKQEIKKISALAGYKIAFITDKDNETRQARVFLHEFNPYTRNALERNTTRFVDENGNPGEEFHPLPTLASNRNFSKPKIKAISQSMADQKYHVEIHKEVHSWVQQITDKCGGTLTGGHEGDKRHGKVYYGWDEKRFDPQWNIIPYEMVDLAQWKQSGDKISHKSGATIRVMVSTQHEPSFLVKVPQSLVENNQDEFRFNDVSEAMSFAQTLALMLDKSSTMTGHKAAHISADRYIYHSKTHEALVEFEVLGLVGTKAAAMLVRRSNGKLALFNVPNANSAKQILTKHLDDVKKPVQAIYDLLDEAMGRKLNEVTSRKNTPPPGRFSYIDEKGLVDKQDTQALEAQFRKMKNMADEFNTQIQEANNQNTAQLEKRRVNFKCILDQVGEPGAKPRGPKA